MNPLRIDIPLDEPGTPFKAPWSILACAGRAEEGLRARWQEQLRRAKNDVGFRYLRFHGIFHDDMMVYREVPVFGGGTRVILNWHYLDDFFDFLLSIGVRPFLELGFMPGDLASGDATCFRWKGNITPPRNWDRWEDLVRSLALHCVQRYGREEVRRWYFEVWNEPNLWEYFWRGSQEDYFRLYRISARALKGVDQALRVGGPATSNFSKGEGPWIRDFLDYCGREGLPVDFISSHPYPNHWPVDPETGKRKVAFRSPSALEEDCRWLRKTVAESAFPEAEIHITEWNSSFLPWDAVHDTAFMGPFVARNALSVIGSVDSLGFWTFTDIFEETGAGDAVFHGGFGLMNYRGLPKPAYHAYHFLSMLGDRMVSQGENYAVARNGEAVQVLLWNYAHFSTDYTVGGQFDPRNPDPYSAFETVQSLSAVLALRGAQEKIDYRIRRVSRRQGSALDAWLAMGRPEYPSEEEYRFLSAVAEPSLRRGTLAPGAMLELEPLEAHELVFVEFTVP